MPLILGSIFSVYKEGPCIICFNIYQHWTTGGPGTKNCEFIKNPDLSLSSDSSENCFTLHMVKHCHSSLLMAISYIQVDNADRNWHEVQGFYLLREDLIDLTICVQGTRVMAKDGCPVDRRKGRCTKMLPVLCVASDHVSFHVSIPAWGWHSESIGEMICRNKLGLICLLGTVSFPFYRKIYVFQWKTLTHL